jgi:hypothetical protein
MLTTEQYSLLSESNDPTIIRLLEHWEDARDSIQYWMDELAQDNLSGSDQMSFNYQKGVATGKMLAYTHVLLTIKYGEA